jgi:hypothetical protein
MKALKESAVIVFRELSGWQRQASHAGWARRSWLSAASHILLLSYAIDFLASIDGTAA